MDEIHDTAEIKEHDTDSTKKNWSPRSEPQAPCGPVTWSEDGGRTGHRGPTSAGTYLDQARARVRDDQDRR